jgi:PAS domain S-box-containing protein
MSSTVAKLHTSRVAQEVFDLLCRSAFLGVALLDPAGEVRAVNEPCCLLTGESRESLLAGGWSGLLQEISVEESLGHWDRLATGTESVVRFGPALSEVDGPGTARQYACLALADDSGAGLGGVVVVIEPADAATGETLRGTQASLALVLEVTSDGLWDWDVPSGRAFFSPRYYRMLGYEPNEFTPGYESWRALVHPDELPAVEQQIRGCVQSFDGAFESEFRMRSKDGTWRWILSRGKIVARDPLGLPQRMVGTHVDITERKLATEERLHLERQMQYAQRLESLGVLAGGVAHDFNNLLAAIMGNADLALLDLPSESPLRGLIEEISRAGRRAAELCRQMLAYSGRVRFIMQPLDLSQLLDQMTHMLQASVSKKVVLRYNLDRQLPLIEADSSQLQQVLVNLVLNASEAIGDGVGTVSLATGSMRASRNYLLSCQVGDPLSPGRYAFVEVTDNGAGMSAETLSRIFDPFFSTKFPGRGLGLAAVVGIVASHKGAIHVKSTLDKGTVFRILFPTSESDEADAPDLAPRVRDAAGRGAVLLVDDEEQVRTMGRRMLQRLGFEVVVAEDGQKALTECLACEGDFACVVLDLTMPVFDGAETLKAMRQRFPALPIVIASGYGETEVAQRLGDRTISGFIQKPFQFEELKRVMIDALSDRPRAGPST